MKTNKNELRITEKDLDRDNFYKENSIDTDLPIHIEAGLGCVGFRGSIRTTSYIVAESGSGISAGGGINAGTGIKAGRGVEAGSDIEAGWSIEVGTGIKAGRGVEAGEGITAGSGIEAGLGINAGLSIITLSDGITAKTISCLRVAVGLNSTYEYTIEAKILRGEVILGRIVEPKEDKNKEERRKRMKN